MTRRGRWPAGRALLASGMVLLASGPALGHGSGAVIEVEPSTVTAGGTVTLVGENLEPKDDRILILTGADVRLELGTVTTDADGMFSIKIVIPAHLPSAVYEFQAIGDETLTVQLNVEGMAGSSPGGVPRAAEPAPRQRSGFGLAALLAVAAASLAAGVLLAIRAERIGGHRSATG
jgi:hypothetical protein